ncbi:FAD:protein FMN transferase [Testudinibacter aquarius]|uniref:FAD:protein FMN transferase n=1 Tax=Testudinibacter aquarius TaxID=1524974 RepID=A0A4R3Y065_9PAST|nr:FAD:protein FMN transferase [Testudinibacter aquarius]KAE9528263.1 thiamine biosynthesis protein ApbE [Testudinibacter aquarius]TCV84827.1 thiamine biosynthesis lipoprotein [Testudinibacter aquarius]TNG92355.1 FAD:protein FMN transferase [Testudinibacter aquarius]
MLLKQVSYWLARIGLAFFISFSVVACGDHSTEVVFGGKTMGTTYNVKYLADSKLDLPSPDEVQKVLDRTLQEVNRQMSTYQKDSEISRFNQLQQADTPFAIAPEFGKVVEEAIRLNQVTEGALDITVGPLVNLWGFGPENRPDKAPTEQEIQDRRTWVGIEKLHLDKQDGQYQLRKSVPNLYIDLSAIAKGFGVDQLASYLDSLHIEHYMVEIGGEVRAKGLNKEGKAWQIAIEKPEFDGSRAVQQIIGLQNMAMATSGDYRNYFEQDGVRFSHEIDPKTGKPIGHNLVSITVLSPSCMTADGLATGLFVLGADKALEIAEKNKLAVYLIIKTNNGFEIKMSSAFKPMLAQ